MTDLQHDLIVRPITGADELDLFCGFPYVINHELADDLAIGRRRPGWMWVAMRGDRLLARVAWWAREDGADPMYLDIVDLEHGADEVAVELLRTAMAQVLPAGSKPPEYGRFIPPDWRDDASARQMVEDRMAVVGRLGARLFVERLRLEWRPGAGLPKPGERLEFRPVRDRDELVGLMTRLLDGTLDAHSRHDLTRMPAARAAAEQYDDEMATYTTPREWWKVAMLPGGEPVGFVIPARNAYNPIIAYLGVLPEHRGNGYIDEILAEGTRVLAAEDVPRIRAATDLGNAPMAAAFARAGYVNFEREINMTWQ